MTSPPGPRFLQTLERSPHRGRSAISSSPGTCTTTGSDGRQLAYIVCGTGGSRVPVHQPSTSRTNGRSVVSAIGLSLRESADSSV